MSSHSPESPANNDLWEKIRQLAKNDAGIAALLKLGDATLFDKESALLRIIVYQSTELKRLRVKLLTQQLQGRGKTVVISAVESEDAPFN